MDADALGERILLDLRNVFKKDPQIDEFDVLPVRESPRNKCPVIHVEHKVALENWCVKHVYVYAYSKFFAWRMKPHKVDPENLLMWSNTILLINPEPETVWNARKEFMCQNLILPKNELKFCELVLKRKPKSSPAYAHRKWVLLQIKKTNPKLCMKEIVEHELQLCSHFANLYPSNYYAWCHRSWVMEALVTAQAQSMTILEELRETEDWTSSHVSDHCGFHYRQFLLSRLQREDHIESSTTETSSCSKSEYVYKEIKKELDLLGRLQTFYQGHEAMWYHRRYLLKEIDKYDEASLQECCLADSCSSCGTDIQQEQNKSTDMGGEEGLSIDNGDVSMKQCQKCGLECKELNTEDKSSIVDIQNSCGADSVDDSVQCKKHKLNTANLEQEQMHMIKNDLEIQSSIGEIHSLAIEDKGAFTEEPAQCKRHKLMPNRPPSSAKAETPSNVAHRSDKADVHNHTEDASIQCKRYKLKCGQIGQASNSKGEALLENKSHCRQERIKVRTLEEKDFLTVAMSKCEERDWERTLIQRHVDWLSRMLKWLC